MSARSLIIYRFILLALVSSTAERKCGGGGGGVRAGQVVDDAILRGVVALSGIGRRCGGVARNWQRFGELGRCGRHGVREGGAHLIATRIRVSVIRRQYLFFDVRRYIRAITLGEHAGFPNHV